jgi:hypothetical protein
VGWAPAERDVGDARQPEGGIDPTAGDGGGGDHDEHT